ncbi:PREDICTED: doublecortin domain-containing protein 1 [Dipodomys ordii]|uniref:Doublecortin domain-containing protein 1 n=1 Tax=Dipodomys ordii TaxID=10020 RepID=A0A1S3FEH9_DIPOR|nr:PREDICTED: doublecortin domain-containing protein 1 [Dipodomys ordii]
MTINAKLHGNCKGLFLLEWSNFLDDSITLALGKGCPVTFYSMVTSEKISGESARLKVAKIEEAKDPREALCGSLSSLMKPMEVLDENAVDAIVQYISNDLPRELMSSQAKAIIKTTDNSLRPPFVPSRLLHSVGGSDGSGHQDCCTHQTATDHSYEEISNPDSYISNSKNNSRFISASKRNRHVRALVGQLRVSENSLTFYSAQNWQRLSKRYKLQPRVIKVTAYRNGSRTVFAKVTAPTISLLLEECTDKLNLNTAARRVFLADGKEALKPEDVPQEADVYVSTGEPFIDPHRKIKGEKGMKKKPYPHTNGTSLSSQLYQEASNTQTMVQVLDICTTRMNLHSPARYLYDLYGKIIKDVSTVPLLEKCLQNSITPLRGPLWVSKGEGFSPSGAKMYIQEVLLALYQRLKSAKKYYEQKILLSPSIRLLMCNSVASHDGSTESGVLSAHQWVR